MTESKFGSNYGFVESTNDSKYRKTLCVQELILIGSLKPNLAPITKNISKESIGKVHTCTLSNPTNWSSLNGDSFCGVKIGRDTWLNANKACKERNAKLPQPRSKIAMTKFLKTFQPFRVDSTDNWIWLDMADVNKTGLIFLINFVKPKVKILVIKSV